MELICGPSWSSGGYDTPENKDKPRWWDADDIHTFDQQCEAVLEWQKFCNYPKESIDYLKSQMQELKEKAEELAKPIRSYWI